ncbi:ferric iron reductase, partial [Acinetobacter sp.]|uniref:ferric iron reductase n=1 Tax=Acinetobacter sp. TaxID=472 RepID=UPI00257C2706
VRGIANNKIGFGDLILLLRYFFKLKVSTHPSYYFFGNTLFGIINAIGATGYIAEDELLEHLKGFLQDLLQQYPESTLLQGLLFNETLPYKGNLLTRLHELDELIAPVEHQSVYVQLQNPLFVEQKDVSYA